MRIISLGWGVQSWTLAAMAALGEIPAVDAVVHADTTWERQSTYAFAAQWTPWLEARGVRVVTARDEHRPDPNDIGGGVGLPAYTRSTDGEIDGTLRRQCTYSWKIAPVRRWLQANRAGQPVTQLLGISLDEWHRAKDSDVKYIRHEWPLIDMKMRRSDCVQWLQTLELGVPDKSACVFYPYHNRKAWEAMKREGGPDWETAVRVDTEIRDKRPPYPLFVHSARRPLAEAVRIPEDEGYTQTTMFDVPDEQCDSGYCFL